MPVVFVATTLLGIPFSWFVSKLVDSTFRESIKAKLPITPEDMRMRIWDFIRVVIFTGLLFFSTLLKNSMAVLTCVPSPSGAMTVSTYPHLVCFTTDEKWLTLAVVSIVAFFAYIGGITVSVFRAWTLAVRTMAATDMTDRGWFAFVFDDFRNGCMIWSMVLMAKETAFVLIAVVLPGQGAAQLLLTAALALALLVRLTSDNPYQDRSNTLMEVWNLGSVVLICFYSTGMGYQSTPGVGNIIELFQDGDSDPIYRVRAIGMVAVQVIAILGPLLIITYQLFCATRFTIRCVPSSMRPPTEEQTSEWIQHFSTAFGVPLALMTVIERFDSVDFGRFQFIFDTSPAVIGLFKTSTKNSQRSFERRRLSLEGAKNRSFSAQQLESTEQAEGSEQHRSEEVQDTPGDAKPTYEELVKMMEKQSQDIAELKAENLLLKGSMATQHDQQDRADDAPSPAPIMRESL